MDSFSKESVEAIDLVHILLSHTKLFLSLKSIRKYLLGAVANIHYKPNLERFSVPLHLHEH